MWGEIILVLVAFCLFAAVVLWTLMWDMNDE